MNCRAFKSRLPEWLSRRLSAEQTQAMERHRQTCPACARAAAAEWKINRVWQDSKLSPVIDLWPHLEGKLIVSGERDVKVTAGQKWGTRTRLPRWALAAAFTVVALGVCRWETLPRNLARDRPAPGSQSRLEQSAVPGSQKSQSEALVRVSESWSALSDVPQSDLPVDDPVGANMENVWTCLKTQNK